MNIFYGHSPPSTDSRSAFWYRLTDHLGMTISVDQDVKPQTKHLAENS